MSILSKWKKKRKAARKAGLAKFEGRINIAKSIGEDRKYTVMEAFTYKSDKYGEFTVLPGFVTDGASVPRLFWAYASPFTGRHVAAVILHDALYAVHYRDRESCDEIMREALVDLGIRTTKSGLMHRSVRAGGWVAWEKAEKHANEHERYLAWVPERMPV